MLVPGRLYGFVYYVELTRLLVTSLNLSAWSGDVPFGDMSLTNSI